MASPVNSQLKYFLCFLMVAIFSFFLMFFFSPKINVHKIYDRKVTKPGFFGAAEDPEACIGLEYQREHVTRHGRVMPEAQLVMSHGKGVY